jgi:hypothetical protein
MSPNKQTWYANAVQADAMPDELDRKQQVVHLIVRLGIHATPTDQIGRQVVVILTRPMLEVLAQLAEDVGAVYHVMVHDPAYEYYDKESTQ